MFLNDLPRLLLLLWFLQLCFKWMKSLRNKGELSDCLTSGSCSSLFLLSPFPRPLKTDLQDSRSLQSSAQNLYCHTIQAQICRPFSLADLHLFNWAVCQKARPAWVMKAFVYLHSWHSLCISSVGWGFPGPCMDAQRRTNRMFAT